MTEHNAPSTDKPAAPAAPATPAAPAPDRPATDENSGRTTQTGEKPTEKS